MVVLRGDTIRRRIQYVMGCGVPVSLSDLFYAWWGVPILTHFCHDGMPLRSAPPKVACSSTMCPWSFEWWLNQPPIDKPGPGLPQPQKLVEPHLSATSLLQGCLVSCPFSTINVQPAAMLKLKVRLLYVRHRWILIQFLIQSGNLCLFIDVLSTFTLNAVLP